MAEFEIRRGYPGNNISRKYASAAVRGLALGAHASDPESAALAGGTNFIGFLTRAVQVGGPVLADHVYPGRLELPFNAGDEVSLCKADEVELEDKLLVGTATTRLVTSGTGAISTSTSVGAELSFTSGKVYVKQSGDITYYTLSAQLTPETAGQVRILAEKV